ncbi:ABC transporter ATP-binding protein [Clostridium tagluense]|uniref:ABC transporter ATP-binding protein n=1 Tax=Clostridium tagluense TaxID=360422 RepID=UPI001C6EB564|nr:ABC transporter ATP-binding protein [Clostridium tagluense]MBW9158769.1 ABC transporter ATP-binding protein/permease [Clostridium tagluense]WLC66527.1 ABC transporter ATP-binding protein/permease [Clostridium tagluense]
MNEKKQNPLSILFKWAGKEKYKLYFSMFCGFVSGLMVIAPYIAIYKIIENIYFKQLTREILLQYSILLTISIILRYFFMAVGIVASHKGAYNALYNVRCMIINHMAKIPLGYLNEKSAGEIKKVISEDIEKLELFLAHHLSEIFMYLSGPIAIFGYLCTVNPILALITLIPIPICVLLQFMMFKGQSTRMNELNKVTGNLNSVMIEYINGMKLIKAYDMGADSYKKYKGAIDEQHSLWKKIAYKMGPLYAVFVIVLQCGVVFVIPMGGFMYNHGSAKAGALILFAFVGSLYLSELRPLMELGSNFSQVLNGINNAKAIIEIPAYEKGDKAFPNNTEIKLKDVSFSYDGKINILNKVNLTIKAGEKIAFVGRSGAGKSTIMQLIARSFDTNKGRILIGGKDIKDIDYETLLQNISIVFQNTFLTKESILENIKMGKEASFNEVKTAAKKAQIHDFIESLPEGYDTKVGSYGSRFSGGEKQRIAIARAILKNAPILILDEATSAADPEKQQEIDVAIDDLCKNKTVIIIAHRLNIVRKCDRVAIVENNTVTDIGVHDELLKTNEYYRQIWDFYDKSKNIQYSVKAGE